MTRVIHTGDTHIGYQQYHVPERRDDFLDAFRQVVDDAIGSGADAVVHAGDLFHDRRPTLTDVLGTLDVLERLDDADIPFLAVVGNHEAKRDAQWLDLYESLGLATRLDDEPRVIGDTAFYGLDYVPRSQRDALDYDFRSHDADHAALVSHGQFQPFDYGTWDATAIVDEATVDFDALLLGDEHTPGTKQVDETWLTYCGSTERASADERDDRGYNIVTFDGDVTITRRGLDTREFVFVEVELAGDEGLEHVRERVGEYDLTDAVVIVHVDGEGEPITPAGIEEFALERGALVARVTDHREFADEREVEVSFADPDEAVHERVRELGLSEAARDIDETIRASKVPDSNVADTVEERVADLVEAGDLAVFDGADAESAHPETEADGGHAPTDDRSSASDERADDAAADQPADDAAGETESGDPDDQSTMEEYL
ncbi:DNA double-strand break repair protein Mre11 [Halomicrobium sp. LC1Hm]|uniref:DNA double-strand break repair protein Mre11 n=1 Tax=Halomicrobium sp. LC1Hm TaxID=2610902 RepID=UPI0012984D91|nr:DNA double-strand break repair protein Mre11 [Halomicrobium sp. LC1Hm]QGA83284.1 DNA repair exonuclease, SbcD [Halomicrobium sp. LC1Hm]